MKDLVEFPRKILNILGFLVPNPNTKTVIILLIICELFIASDVIISTINYFYVSDVYEFTNNLQAHSGMFGAFAKCTWCIYYKNDLVKLFEKRKGFWNTNNCSKTTKRSVSRILNTVSFLQKAFVYQTAVLVFAFMIPFSIVKKTLVLGNFYITDDPLIYFIVWTSNALAVAVAISSTVNFDGLFIGICYEVIAQFKILCDHLERLDVENIRSEEEFQDFVDKFKLYSKHHKFLLRYIQDIKDCFSVVYLIQYLVTAPMVFTSMYVALESPIFMQKIFNTVVTIDSICEFALYCIPATYMTEETLKVATAIYNSNWYGRHFGKLKKATQLKIQDAQQGVRMTSLGGMVDINTKTLIMIVRTSFSICTVLRNLKK